jgi:hypothetical protein
MIGAHAPDERIARAATRSSPWPTSRVGIAILGMLLGVLTVTCAASAVSSQIPFSEYLEQARRCVELNDCPSRGGHAGIAALPLHHGTIWLRLLAHSLRTGSGLIWVQHVVLGLWILAIPITFLFLKRYLGLGAAVLAIGLYLPVILTGTEIRILDYTDLTPLPLALFYACLALWVESGRIAFAAGASVALAVAVSAELGFIVLLPLALCVVGFGRRRATLAVAVSVLSFAIPYCWDSLDAAREIVGQMLTIRVAVAALLCGGAVALVGRSYVRPRLSPELLPLDRVRALMVMALIYTTAAVWITCALAQHGVPSPRYLLPASFPFLFLIAERMTRLQPQAMILLGVVEGVALLLLSLAPESLDVLQVAVAIIVTLFALGTLRNEWFGKRSAPLWPCVAVCVCAIAISIGGLTVRIKRGPSQTFTLAEVERLIPKLYASGIAYPELLGSLQGPAADDLAALLTARDPKLFSEPAPPLAAPDFTLLALKVPDAAMPAGQDVIAAVAVDDDRTALVVRGERAYLDWLHMRRCSWTSGPGATSVYRCAVPVLDRALPHNWPYVQFGDPVPADSAGRSEDSGIIYEVPVRTPGRGRAHVVRTPNEWPATWRITRVRGVDFTDAVPATEIRLPDTRAAAGVVEFEFTSPLGGDLPWVWRPHSVELTEDEAHLWESPATR